MPVGEHATALYRQLIQTIVSHSEDVGHSFADEARKIHYNEAPQRPIPDTEFAGTQRRALAETIFSSRACVSLLLRSLD